MFNPDYEIRKQIIDVTLTDKIKYCYQCSRCTDVCPVAKAAGDDKYNPRFLVLGSVLGLKNLLVNTLKENSFAVWGCQVCDTCDEECPQSIPVTEIITLLRNISVSLGIVPEYYTGQAKMIFEHGKAIPMQDAIARRREKMEIPSVQAPDINEIQTILKATGLDKKIGG